jgi:type I restriction enzyme S subunit
VDALISGLDRLIAKKRDLKRAAMQQLLTGKRRLPGFSGELEVKKLGDLGKFRGGSGFPIKYQGGVEGDYPFFKVSDMNNEGNSTFMISSNNWVSQTVSKEMGAKTFPKHSIVFAKIGAAIFLERKKVLSQESCIDNNMMGFVLDEGVAYYKFIHYLFLHIQLGKLVSTTALPSLNGREIAGLEYGIPNLEEQTAIAAVLSDMDAELAGLEQRRDKTRSLKQAMMQELLTGKTRLVAAGGSHA